MATDLQNLKKQDEARRRFTIKDGDIVFELRRPTRQEMRLVLVRGRDPVTGDLSPLLLTGHIVRLALVGCAGMKVADVNPDTEDAEFAAMDVPFDLDLCMTYIEERTELLDRMSTEVMTRVETIKTQITAAEKNSVRVSPTS